MADLYANLRYQYIHGSMKILFDSMSYDGGTQVSKYAIMTNGLNTAINGKNPPQLILKGRFLRDDFSSICEYIKNNTGNVISSFTVDSDRFISMILTKAEANLGKDCVLGEITFIFQEAVES